MSSRAAVSGQGRASLAVLAITFALLATTVGRARHREAELHAQAFERLQALAGAALAAARDEHALWLNTEALLARAVALAASGATADASALAEAARREAQLARNQARLEAVRYQLDLQRDVLASGDVAELEGLLRRHDGAAALRRARQLGLAATP